MNELFELTKSIARRYAEGIKRSENMKCNHNWQRRRDGKQCAICGEIKFGEFVEQTQHTPTPWHAQFYEDQPTGNFVGEIHADGVSIAKQINMHTHAREWIQESDANLEFIVRAVNSYEKLKRDNEVLLEKARNIRRLFIEKEGEYLHHMTRNWKIGFEDSMKELEQAIAQAEGK